MARRRWDGGITTKRAKNLRPISDGQDRQTATVPKESIINRPLRFVFAGSGDFATSVLERLVQAGVCPSRILTQPDRPSGRGRRLIGTPVKRYSEEALPALGFDVSTDSVTLYRELSVCDALLVVDYGRIIPEALLNLPRYGGINLHPSLLPRWRGAAPIERAILAGDHETGVCVIRMDATLDTGAVYACDVVGIKEDETAGELSARLALIGADLLLRIMVSLSRGERPPVVRQRGESVYAARISKSEARLDFSQSSQMLARAVRAFNPRPLAWCEVEGQRVRILRAHCISAEPEALPGTVVAAGEEGIDVATGDGLLRVTQLQRAGRRVQMAGDVLRGWELLNRRMT